MDKTTENRIVTDAYRKYTLPSEGGQRIGYQEGATAEIEHMRPVIEAAEKVAKIFAHKGDHQTCAICQLAKALEQCNGTGKEVDKCRCVQPNWNAFTGKCLTCGKH